MTYMEIFNLRASYAMRARVAVACINAAQEILAEANSVPDHAQRLKWAYTALNDSVLTAEKILWGVVSSAAIQAAGEEATDQAIQAAVNSLIPIHMKGA